MPPQGKTPRLVLQAVEIRSSPSHPTISADQLPRSLPPEFSPCLIRQKQNILNALRRPPLFHGLGDKDDDGPTMNEVACNQLKNLLDGTVNRGEGNSCLIMGPRGTGKSRLLEEQLEGLGDKVIIIRLCGWAQRTDRLAMREIAYQLTKQTGSTFLLRDDDEEPEDGQKPQMDIEDNPFLGPSLDEKPTDVPSVSLPPASHLPALIAVLPTLSRPTVVILDAFELFALHPRQSLLYCLLDTAQSCRADAGNKGIAVIGVTARVDANNMLEKRVKSRFSGRIIRSSSPAHVQDWLGITRRILLVDVDLIGVNNNVASTWQAWWKAAVNAFVQSQSVQDLYRDTFGLVQDGRVLMRLLMHLVAKLTPSFPFPTPQLLMNVMTAQRMRPHYPYLHTLSYPTLCLLIASVHADAAGHLSFTFEMLYDYFQEQVRTSLAALVQVNGASIGMVKCTRDAFESLIAAHIFVPVAAASLTISPEFTKYRCSVDPEEIKRCIEKTAQINLKKWLNKVQNVHN
ncbi:hypothetical protein AX16_003211 [Volvariella volvacea WC 439]|nr:hypothetical protein AX16_003211 [Volvariella volvacea WC 439]